MRSELLAASRREVVDGYSCCKKSASEISNPKKEEVTNNALIEFFDIETLLLQEFVDKLGFLPVFQER